MFDDPSCEFLNYYQFTCQNVKEVWNASIFTLDWFDKNVGDWWGFDVMVWRLNIGAWSCNASLCSSQFCLVWFCVPLISSEWQLWDAHSKNIGNLLILLKPCCIFPCSFVSFRTVKVVVSFTVYCRQIRLKIEEIARLN